MASFVFVTFLIMFIVGFHPVQAAQGLERLQQRRASLACRRASLLQPRGMPSLGAYWLVVNNGRFIEEADQLMTSHGAVHLHPSVQAKTRPGSPTT
jgi:uncharacterized membrane protein SpoIIM required for sporulation